MSKKFDLLTNIHDIEIRFLEPRLHNGKYGWKIDGVFVEYDIITIHDQSPISIICDIIEKLFPEWRTTNKSRICIALPIWLAGVKSYDIYTSIVYSAKVICE